MAASYFENDMRDQATFDLFIRELPEQRNFLVACGLEQALSYLENLHFTEDHLGYLRSLDLFEDRFLSFLGDLRFTGEVWAVPEGEAIFACEPLVRVTAPLIEAQIVESFLLNCLTFQTMIASKAARLKIACGDREFVDYSLRRDHGVDAALKAARASFVAGAVGTSNVLAGKLYGIPVSGTMAHSYVMAFGDEISAFRAYARQFADRTVLLIDTFDVEEGTRNAVRVAKETEAAGGKVDAVRIDSGDLADLTRSVRKILDEDGLDHVKIVLSGDLDEYRIRRLLEANVPADVFGVGTQLGTSGDAASLGGAYKLVQDSNGPRIKLSAGKATTPGRKQVVRFGDGNDERHDLITLEDEEVAGGRPLLERVMAEGHPTRPPEPLAVLKDRCRRAVTSLPERLLTLEGTPDPYQVRLSSRLRDLVDQMHRSSR
ncbi:MAG: nicotinate phosphoribosyltransferase [Actinobacteria bacterium]|nr:nicotinate phosphoribosyltransferase [Actinomycetota bacterium]